MTTRSLRPAVLSLVVLTAVYAFAFVDRQILNMLVGPMKERFGLSDLEISYLIGPAFIFSFMAVGLPAGLCVDRFNRRNLVLGAGLLWTVATAAASLAENFTHLAISRMFVGGAEAVLFPAGMSMIADTFDRRHLPAANSLFLTSPYIGGGLALIAGGHILDATRTMPPVSLAGLATIHGWQIIFLIVAAIGLVPLLLMLLVREPARRGDAARSKATVPAGEAFLFLLRNWRFYGFFYLGMGIACQVQAMVAAWAPTHLARTFDLGAGAIGTGYGVMVLFAGLAGGISGPLVNHLLSKRSPNSTMMTATLGPVLIVLFVLLLTQATTPTATMICLAMFTMSYSFPLSTAGSSLQVVTPPSMMGMTSAIYLICNSVLGYALGPTLVPLVSRVMPGGGESIGTTLTVLAGFGGVASLLALIAAARGFAGMAQARD